MMRMSSGIARSKSERHVVRVTGLSAALRFGLLLRLRPGFLQVILGRRVFRVPPGVRRPINWGTAAVGGAAFQPKSIVLALPDAHRMAIEFFAAVQTPMFLVEVGPITAHAVVTQQVELLIKRQGDVLGHRYPFSLTPRRASNSTRPLNTSSRSWPSSARASWAVSKPYLTPMS